MPHGREDGRAAHHMTLAFREENDKTGIADPAAITLEPTEQGRSCLQKMSAPSQKPYASCGISDTNTQQEVQPFRAECLNFLSDVARVPPT